MLRTGWVWDQLVLLFGHGSANALNITYLSPYSKTLPKWQWGLPGATAAPPLGVAGLKTFEVDFDETRWVLTSLTKNCWWGFACCDSWRVLSFSSPCSLDFPAKLGATERGICILAFISIHLSLDWKCFVAFCKAGALGLTAPPALPGLANTSFGVTKIVCGNREKISLCCLLWINLL